jgi:hypothetical protein
MLVLVQSETAVYLNRVRENARVPPLPVPQQPLSPTLQDTVDKFAASLETPRRLLKLAPSQAGNPGNAGAINPAIVLTVTSAFEGFAEDFLATYLAQQGQGFAQIARVVGNWNNPTLNAWSAEVRKLLSQPAQQALDVGPVPKIVVDRMNANGNWSAGSRSWPDVLTDSEAWMQVRHLLTHGQARGWRAEAWPPPLRKSAPPASSVLRPKPGNKWALERPGARSCARIYTLGAKHVADVAGGDVNVTFDWSSLPTFEA